MIARQAFGKSAAASAEAGKAGPKTGTPAAAAEMLKEADDVQLDFGGKVKAFLGEDAHAVRQAFAVSTLDMRASMKM